MPLKLYPPRPGKTPNWTVRGTYLGIAVDRSAGTPKKPVADRELKKLEAAIERGEYPPKPVQQTASATFLSAALKYLKNGGSRKGVKALIEHFGATPIEQIGQIEIDDAAIALYPNCAASTRNRLVYTPVGAILHGSGVKITIQRPKGYKGSQKTLFMSPAEAFAIIDAANKLDPEMGRLLSFLLYTGCRIGEALALTWDRVQIEQRTAYIETSKNGDPRTVKMTEPLCDLLKPFARDTGKVFRFHQGGHRNFIFLNAKVTACGLTAVKRPRRGQKMTVPPYRYAWVTFHSFRHTWASWMRQYGGADLQGLVATGQWRDPRSAARYAHVVAGDEWGRTDYLPQAGKSVELNSPKAKAK